MRPKNTLSICAFLPLCQSLGSVVHGDLLVPRLSSTMRQHQTFLCIFLKQSFTEKTRTATDKEICLSYLGTFPDKQGSPG